MAGAGGGAGDTDVIHYDLDIEIIPSAEEIAGQNVITVESLVDGLTEFGVRLSDGFGVTDVRVNGVPASWAWASGVELTVTLDRAYDAGERFDVLVGYAGQAVGLGFGSIVWSSDPLGNPFVYTLSETEFAYTWWPNKDDARDKATADLRFTFPEDLHLVSNGLLVSDTGVGGGRRQRHYRTAYETATYLFAFGLGDYNTFSGAHAHAGGVMPLEFAILATSDSPGARDAWLRTEQMLPVFDGLFGLYPFIDEKYGIYEFGFGGGMEHQTMSGQGTASESVTAHELAHQWWGDLVTCATWHDIWLNEGFATYSETLWLEHKGGKSSASARKLAMAVRTPSDVSESVYVYDTSDLYRIFDYDHSYLKGGWVLHMLRGVVGDQAFFDTLAAYRAAHAFGAATTSDFRAVAESVSGMDLGTFFDQWVFQPGALSYQRSFGNVHVDGQDFVEIYLRQVQSASYPTYDMPVGVRLTTGAGTVDATIRSDAREEHLLVKVPAPATSLELDPDLWVLKTGNAQGTYVPGPPKIVAASPAPGETRTDAPPAQLSATFHHDVTIGPGDVSLVGDAWGEIPVSLAYDQPTRTATLTPLQTMPPDTYRLRVSDAVRSAPNLIPLDGEIAGDALPSGDGVPGGEAEVVFAYAPPVVCAGDLDRDNDTDVFDFGIFAVWFGSSGATRETGDFDGSGTVDVFDFADLADDFGCTP